MTNVLFQMTDSEIKAALKADGRKRVTPGMILGFRRDQERVAALSARDLTGMTLKQEQESARAIDAQYPPVTQAEVLNFEIDGKLINLLDIRSCGGKFEFTLPGLDDAWVSRMIHFDWIDAVSGKEDVTTYRMTEAGVKYAEMRS